MEKVGKRGRVSLYIEGREDQLYFSWEGGRAEVAQSHYWEKDEREFLHHGEREE